MDHQWETWTQPPYYPQQPKVWPTTPVPLKVPPKIPIARPVQVPSQKEIDEFRRLLERAREYDRRNNEPDCEMDEKKKRLLDLAAQLGVDISFVDEAVSLRSPAPWDGEAAA